MVLGLAIVEPPPAAVAADPAPAPSITPSAGPSPAPTDGAPATGAPTPSPPPSVPSQTECPTRPLDAAERDTLLRLAWRTLSGHLTDHPIKDTDLQSFSFTPCLLAPRGLFVTLRKGEQVRGLQGEIESTRPLYQQVIVFVRRAATRDPRFPPLAETDLAGLTVDLSIISGRRRVTAPSDIHLESEGVFLEKWGRRALFLPGVASRQGWTTGRTLDELCSQAALPKGSWAESSRLEVFTTEVVSGGRPIEAVPAPSPSPAPSATPSGVSATPAGATRRAALQRLLSEESGTIEDLSVSSSLSISPTRAASLSGFGLTLSAPRARPCARART